MKAKSFQSLPSDIHNFIADRFLDQQNREKIRTALTKNTYAYDQYQDTPTRFQTDNRRQILDLDLLLRAIVNDDVDQVKMYGSILGPKLMSLPLRNGYTPLGFATMRGKRDLIHVIITLIGGPKALLSDVSHIHTPLTSGDRVRVSPLYIAIIEGRTQIAEEMIKTLGENVFIKLFELEKNRDHSGSSLLHIAAAFKGNLHILKMMVKILGIDYLLKERNNYGISPLLSASFAGNVDVVKFLVQVMGRTAVMKDKSKTGFTPLSAAEDQRHAEVVSILKNTIG